jgi:hypothetical protein
MAYSVIIPSEEEWSRCSKKVLLSRKIHTKKGDNKSKVHIKEYMDRKSKNGSYNTKMVRK